MTTPINSNMPAEDQVFDLDQYGEKYDTHLKVSKLHREMFIANSGEAALDNKMKVDGKVITNREFFNQLEANAAVYDARDQEYKEQIAQRKEEAKQAKEAKQAEEAKKKEEEQLTEKPKVEVLQNRCEKQVKELEDLRRNKGGCGTIGKVALIASIICGIVGTILCAVLSAPVSAVFLGAATIIACCLTPLAWIK